MSPRRALPVFPIVIALIGCSQVTDDGSKGETRGSDVTEQQTRRAPGAMPAVSDDTASELAVIAETYRDFRRVTPKPVLVNVRLASSCVGVSQKHVEEARERHGVHDRSAIVIYMNALAAEAFESRQSDYPMGAVIVKEKRRLSYPFENSGWDGDGVGGMIKRGPEFDPGHGNWEYFYFERPDEIESGRIATCIRCHEGAKATDYVFGSWKDTKSIH